MKKILFINQETVPYVPENFVSLMGKLVPKALQAKGCEIRTFMPKWGNINERRGQLHEVIRLSGLNISIDDRDHQLIIKVASIPQTKIQVYFIDNDDFFMKRGMINDDNGVPYPDNGERAIFFARGVIETVKKLRWSPDVIHCQGWMSQFVPIYIKQAYADEPSVANAKVVTSFFGEDSIPQLSDSRMKECIEFRDVTKESLEKYNDAFTGLDLARLAIDNSDAVISASADSTDELSKIIAESGVKHLEYPGEDFADAYLNLYDSICE